MLLIRLLHFINGYVCFSATGGFPERFLNLCARAGIVLWDVESRRGVLYAKTTVRGYLAIRPAARKSGMRVRAREKRGLSFFLHRHKKRAGLLVGLLIFCIVLGFLSTRLWTVEVTGNQTVTREEILETFAELGVSVGVFRRKIELNAAEIAALDRMQALSWVNINIKGSGALITVREKGAEPAFDPPDEPAQLVAVQDGELLVLETYGGTPLAKPGDRILRGDILISAEVKNKDETSTLHNANGYAVARTQHTLQSSIGAQMQALRIVPGSKRYNIQLLGNTIGPGMPQTQEGIHRYRLVHWLELNGRQMPIGYTRMSSFTTEPCTVQFSAQQLRLLALEGYAQQYSEKLGRAQVEAHSLKLTETAESCVILGKSTARENIGLRQVIT